LGGRHVVPNVLFPLEVLGSDPRKGVEKGGWEIGEEVNICLTRCVHFLEALLTKFAVPSPPGSTLTSTSKPVAVVKTQARTIGAHMPHLDKLHIPVPAES